MQPDISQKCPSYFTAKQEASKGVLLCLLMMGALSIPAWTEQDISTNLLRNGGFESGGLQWWHPRKMYGGKIDLAVRHRGLNSWRMDLESFPNEIMISKSARIVRGYGHQVVVWIRCKDVRPVNAITVRVLQFAKGKPNGWVLRGKSPELVYTGGRHDWYRFAVNVLENGINDATDTLTVFLRAAKGATGTVWFDDVAVLPFKGKPPAELLDSQAAPPLSLSTGQTERDDAASFRDIPFLDREGEGLEIDCGSDHNLFYAKEPARIFLKIPVDGKSRLDWIVTDYFGRKVYGGQSKEPVHLIMEEVGYFEVAAKLTRNDRQVAAARTSFFHLPAHPFPRTRPGYPFGSWVQQNDLLDDIGARWTRVGIGWRWLEPQKGKPNAHVWQLMDRSIRLVASQGINPIFLFAKVPSWAGPDSKRVAPEHWGDFRAFVHKCVERYGDTIDVWEVMNEPYIPSLFAGTLEEVMQWHRIVREEVDRADPGGKVIGPCLNTRNDYLFKEMRQLLELGVGKLVDGIAIHTYGGLEADGFLEDIARLRALLREFNVDKPLTITEQGLSVPEVLPLERVQAQYLARMMLLCMEADIKAVIWHMMSWPQGGNAEQRNFAIVRARKKMSQRAPRPAFAAAAVLSSTLGKARFVKSLKGLGKTVGAQVYDRDGAPVLALWEWGQPEREIEIEVGAENVTLINIVGVRQKVKTRKGILRVTLTPDPVYVVGGNSELLSR